MNTILFFLQIIITIAIAFTIASALSRNVATVKLDEKEYSHVPIKNMLSKSSQILVPWRDIVDYVYEQDRAFDIFTINMKNGKRYRFHRLNIIPIKDDFKQLLNEFSHFTRSEKEKQVERTTIDEGTTIYDQKWFEWIFYIFSVMVIFSVIMEINKPGSRSNWGGLGYMVSMMVFYGIKLYKKKTSKN